MTVNVDDSPKHDDVNVIVNVIVNVNVKSKPFSTGSSLKFYYVEESIDRACTMVMCDLSN